MAIYTQKVQQNCPKRQLWCQYGVYASKRLCNYASMRLCIYASMLHFRSPTKATHDLVIVSRAALLYPCGQSLVQPSIQQTRYV